MSNPKRPYVQKSRAAASQALREVIATAFYDLLVVGWIDEITLDEVAAASGTTRRTVIRLFGGKEGLLEAAIRHLRSKARPRFALPPDAGREAAVEALAEHYETTGDIVLRLLAQEARHPALREIMDYGREEHRRWLQERFDADLDSGDARKASRFAQLVIATDVYAWKLLRRDLQRTPEDFRRVIASLVANIGD